MAASDQANAPGAVDQLGDGTYDFSRYFPFQLSFPAGAVARVLGNAMFNRFGLKSAHWRIMSLLGSRGPVSTRELASYMSTEKSAISRATTELIRRGYVIRLEHPVDRRLIMLHFSPTGKRLFAQMIEVALDFERRLLTDIPGAEIDTVVAVLRRLREAALRYESDEAPRSRRRQHRREAATV